MVPRTARRSPSLISLLALTLGFLLSWTVTGYAQGSELITQSGPWAVEIECAAQLPLTISVDGGPSTAVAGSVWSGTGPFVTSVAYPTTPAARTLGSHTFAISVPATTVTLANGDSYTYPAGTLTRSIVVVPDTPPPATPPKFLRWIKVAGTIAATVAALWFGFHG